MANGNGLINLIILKRAEDWIKANPERLNADEKAKFWLDLKAYLRKQDDAITDEVFDFLVDAELITNKPRTTSFVRHLISKYTASTHPKILDVGAGRMCHLSTELGNKGFKVTAMDPKICLENKEIKSRKIQQIIKKPFYCDEYANDNGTNISKYDLIVGMEPCNATEHIIRQSLKYDKPFEVSLCYQAHNGLNGQTFTTPEDWYEYLHDIVKTPDDYIASRK